MLIVVAHDRLTMRHSLEKVHRYLTQSRQGRRDGEWVQTHILVIGVIYRRNDNANSVFLWSGSTSCLVTTLGHAWSALATWVKDWKCYIWNPPRILPLFVTAVILSTVLPWILRVLQGIIKPWGEGMCSQVYVSMPSQKQTDRFVVPQCQNSVSNNKITGYAGFTALTLSSCLNFHC